MPDSNLTPVPATAAAFTFIDEVLQEQEALDALLNNAAAQRRGADLESAAQRAAAPDGDLLALVIGATSVTPPRPEPIINVPEGYRLMPKGIKRQLRVNRDFITGDSAAPLKLLSVTKNKERLCLDVQILGRVKFVAEQGVTPIYRGCSVSRRAVPGTVCLETSAALLIKEA